MTTLPLLTPEHIQNALSGSRPGLRAQALMSPRDRLDPELYRRGSIDCRRAAVLFLLYPHRDELYTLLTVRPDTMPNHPGQVAFPGGSRDEETESVLETALREGQEEVGLEPTLVEPLGRLTHIYIPPSHFCIQIQVAYTRHRPHWRPNPFEVAELLEVPIVHFFDRSNWRTIDVQRDGQQRTIPYFAIGEHRVWGATAMTIAEFVIMVEEAGLDEES
jgi:8-oxo-dGTP pyrophosphatase MutT (NUDIX family)